MLCDFCLEFYHPECINLTNPEAIMESDAPYKCFDCIAKGLLTPLYEARKFEKNRCTTKC